MVHSTRTVTQRPAPSWGLARISNRTVLPPPPAVVGYSYDATAGEGTCGYIIDTGILISHVVYTNPLIPSHRPTRLTKNRTLMDAPGGAPTSSLAHRTRTKTATEPTLPESLEGQRMVLPRSATSSPSRCSMPAVLAPFPASFWAFSGRLTMLGPWAYLVNLSVSLPLICTVARGTDITVKVANMSLGGPKSQPLNDAVAAAVNMGLAIVVAAGNSNADASGFSPASEPLAYTVGSIDINDSKSNFSNFGARMILPSPFPLPPSLISSIYPIASALTGSNSRRCLRPGR